MVLNVYNTNVLVNVLLVFSFFNNVDYDCWGACFWFFLFLDSVNHYSWVVMSSTP